MNKDLINRRNTKTWVLCNDNSKSHIYRDKFLAEHGGEFTKKGRYWEWEFINTSEEEIVKNQQYIFTNEQGVNFIVENVSKFCRENELNKSAIYKVMSGERKHHKGFICKKIY
jgi:hypothetical protein